jgi:hypothetical protein
MVSRLVEQKNALMLVLVSDTKVDNLTPSNSAVAEAFCKTLRPFKDVTVLMSSDRFPTLSNVIPTLHVLTKMMTNMSGGIPQLQQLLVKHIADRWPEYELSTVHSIATALDPHFKMSTFTPDNKSVVVDLVLAEMTKTYNNQLDEGSKDKSSNTGNKQAKQPVPGTSFSQAHDSEPSSIQNECYDSDPKDFTTGTGGNFSQLDMDCIAVDCEVYVNSDDDETAQIADEWESDNDINPEPSFLETLEVSFSINKYDLHLYCYVGKLAFMLHALLTIKVMF